MPEEHLVSVLKLELKEKQPQDDEGQSEEHLVSVFSKNFIRNHYKRRRVARKACGISFQEELNKKPRQDDEGSRRAD